MRARVVAVSPHLDDAVLGCGGLLGTCGAAVVVTIFAGRPPSDTPLAPWDRAAGFAAGDDVIGARRAEDAAALHHLDAHPIWLDFLDAQYAHAPATVDIAETLESVLCAAEPGTVCIPLGLFHSDHALAHAAALDVRARHPRWHWLAYEEPMYRRVPDALGARLRALDAAGIKAVPVDGVPATEGKRHAIACYASQLRALATPGRPGHEDALARERYWALVT